MVPAVESSIATLPLWRRKKIVGWTTVDAEDYERLQQFTWRLSPQGYAYRYEKIDGVWKMRHLARELLGLTTGDARHTDHINRGKLDNRRQNLRAVRQAENKQNLTPRRGTSSVHRGVGWHKGAGKWMAYGVVNRRITYLGLYENEEEAATVASAWRAKHLPFSGDARMEKNHATVSPHAA